jgi:RNA polymerase sigma factor (sigma-70 family)
MRGDNDLSEEEEAYVEEAFAELYRRLAVPLLRLVLGSGAARAYRAARGDNALRSLVNETFLRACRYSHTYDPEKGSVKTWLVAIAKNLAIEALEKETERAGGRERADVEGDDFERAAHRANEVTLTEIGNTGEPDPERVRLINEAIDEALTDRQRELLLPYLTVQAEGDIRDRANEGAVQQLADELGTTTQYLRTNKSRCVDRIENYIEERLVD